MVVAVVLVIPPVRVPQYPLTQSERRRIEHLNAPLIASNGAQQQNANSALWN